MRVAVIAPLIFGSSGYARAGRDILLALESQGVEIRLLGAQPHYDGVIHSETYDRILSYYSVTWKPDIQFNLAPQCYFSFDSDLGGHKIGMSMFESLNNPARFTSACALCDEVWVPSTFCFQTFLANCPSDKLAYLPLGLDTSLYDPQIPSDVIITDAWGIEYDFVFCIICGYSARKGTDLLLLAYAEMFDATDNVALLIKGDRHGGRLFPKDVDDLLKGEGEVFNALSSEQRDRVVSKTRKDLPHILYYFEELTDTDILGIQKAIDCLVFPSRGEGFGLPPLESFALETPVIATKGTALSDLMYSEHSFPINNKGFCVEPRCDWITGATKEYVGALFADPDYDDLCRTMRWVYDHKEEAKEKAKLARTFADKNFSVEVVGRRIKDRLTQILDGKLSTEDFWPYAPQKT